MSYNASDVKVLDEIEHIQLNAGMYIGDTSMPTHLIEELLDNALDECVAGYAKIVAININTKTNVYSILDNGRGIPISNDVPKTISTKLFSGSKFQDKDKTAYDISVGLHGIGLTAVNALSDLYNIEIYRNKRHALFTFKKSKFKTKNIKPYEGKRPFATKVEFKPNKKFFESLIPDIDKLRSRLHIASIELPNCTFVLQVDDKKEVIKVDKETYFKKHCLNEGDKEISEEIRIGARDGKEKFEALFCYSLTGTVTPRVLTSINLLPVDGGTHVNIFSDILRDIFVAKGKKAGVRFLPGDCFCGLRCYLSLALVKPEFSAQTKDRLINRKTSLESLSKKLKTSVETYFNSNPEILQTLLEQFETHRKKIDSKNLKTKGNGRRSSTKFTKLRDCSSKNGELFICEGESAGGGLIQCRDPKKHAVLPLKGKIPNIVNAKEILKNKEIGELIQSLGTGVGPNFDISYLKYDKVIAAMDADSDGGHIFCLLTIVLAILVPDIIKKGHYYLAQTPLYAINEKKNFVPLWDKKSLDKAKKENRNIIRLKGLGELSPWQLKICAIDEPTRRLIPIKFSSDIDKLLKLFSDVNEKRKLLHDDNDGEDSKTTTN